MLLLMASVALTTTRAGFAQQVPPCGNGIVDAGEACDYGPDIIGDCCSSLCQFEPVEVACTGFSNEGLCDNDAADHCSGFDNQCVDVFEAAETTCRLAIGSCDVEEFCDGSSGACPEDGWVVNGTVCDDDLFCNTSETCSAGVCAGGFPQDCTFLNTEFQIGICNETNDMCQALPRDIFSDSFESLL